MNDKERDTIQYYDSNADTFFSDTVGADMSFCMEKFIKHLIKTGTDKKALRDYLILDAGCGSGRDSKAFIEKGFQVEAFDASREIASRASAYTGIEVKQLRFEDFAQTEKYDGIWACASLLHVRRDNLVDAVRKLSAGLKPQGVMYASFKYGNIERIKSDRFFCDMNEDRINKLFKTTNMSIMELFITGDVRQDRNQEQWINVIAKRCI